MRMLLDRRFAIALLLASLFCVGCGAGNDKCVITATISPASAMADHTQVAPGNQAQFSFMVRTSGNCAAIATQVMPHWTTSDMVNTSIDPGTGLATCINATPKAATISASGAAGATATLTCK